VTSEAPGSGNAGDAVVTRELTKKFGAFGAVDQVSFAVRTGEIFGFLGPNGAGKTTTIKMLTGLLHPTFGTATVAGFDLHTQRDAIKRSIGYMSQLFSLYGDLTVRENIDFFARLYSVPRAELADRRRRVLEIAGIVEQENRLTAQLPLGWKQRLALGCAVLHDPPILFLDEPTSGVDPRSRREFWELVNSLSESGTTIFVSTHYMEEAEYCHRLALMNRGRLVALDSPHALRRSMREPLLEIRCSSAPRAVEALRDAPGVVEAAMFGRHVHAAVEDAAGAQESIPVLLAASGVETESVEEIAPSLEDVFVSRIRAAGGAPTD
jgi:ABC-2 type transport system ATP-binding protein